MRQRKIDMRYVRAQAHAGYNARLMKGFQEESTKPTVDLKLSEGKESWKSMLVGTNTVDISVGDEW